MLHHRSLHLSALALACAMSAQAQTPAAPTAQRHYDMPAQPLGSTLARIAADNGQQLSLDAELVRGHTAPALHGSYTAEQAARAALAGSGLELVHTAGGNWSLRAAPAGKPVSAAEPQQGSGATLAEVRVTAQAERHATTEQTGSYTSRAVTIGKGEQAMKDIPQSVSVVTRQLMDEQNATSVYDALGSTTGITLLQSPQGGKYIYSRGFSMATIQYDGVNVQRLYGRASNYQGGTAIYDRAEVLRGSAGLMQGGGDPSGVVNLVRKRPLKEGGVNVTAKAGSWDRYGAQVDGSGALNADGSLRGRAVIDVEDQHSFIDYANQRNATLYGTLEYDLSPQTQVSVGASYESFKGRPFISGLPHYSDGRDIGLPRSTYLGASWNRQDNSTKTLYADLSHQFNSRWRAKVSAMHVQEDLDMKYASSQRAVATSTGLGATVTNLTQADQSASGLDANLTGDFSAFGREHQIVLGASYSRGKATSDYSSITPAVPVNVFDPNPFREEPSNEAIRYANTERFVGTTRQVGVYGALRLQVTDPLKLVMGGRLGNYKSEYDLITTTTGNVTTSNSRQANTRFMPFAGLIYALNPEWSAYASYADIFNPQASLNAAGQNLKPIQGATYEIGLKGELFGGRANTSFALYRVDQKNRATEDIASGPNCRDGYYCYSDDGKVRSQGLDAEISGELTRGWNLFAGYTFNRNTYKRDVYNEGQDFNTYTPKHMLRLWTTYRLPGAMSAFTIGGGVNAQSASYRKIGTISLNAPGRAVWSSYVRYQINRQWQASLNFNNMFDKRYYNSIGNLVNSSHYGDPRNVMLTLRGTF
ncbi:Fe(3+)-pyochelin receptor [Comamonas sp. PE63]|uniref:Fe(3+)-pyochelin receptor n=1 Tax=Comamonas brasiliensis TaxID=1812482 RepID=A0ABS5LTD8_9BURK|nr:TonB-dependent siderophore receptor [Comamonas sp. PE63]MBS3019763.1 Fe(3+)-pyochelin receptor [Comamonas sp. PE63]